MPERNPRTTYSTCAHGDCERQVANHAWGRIKADGWFQQTDGRVWCPEHVPDWVEPWREMQAELARLGRLRKEEPDRAGEVDAEMGRVRRAYYRAHPRQRRDRPGPEPSCMIPDCGCSGEAHP